MGDTGMGGARMRIERYDAGSTAQIMLAATLEDITYDDGDVDSAAELWRRYVPPTMVLHGAPSPQTSRSPSSIQLDYGFG